VDGGTLHVLFCVEYARCYWMQSANDGETFSKPVDITATFEQFRTDYDWKVIATGPGRLPVPVWLSDGRVMLNIRNESPEHRRAVSISADGAVGWSKFALHSEVVELSAWAAFSA